MSKTSVATGTPLAKKVYVEKLFRDVVKNSFFSRFMSEKPDNMVYVKTDLEKGKGETLTFPLRMRATGDGVSGNQVLEGFEESLSFYDYSLTLNKYRHGIRDDGELTRQRTAFDMDVESEQAIKDWGEEKIDKLCFDAILANPSKVFYRDSSGNSTAGSAATAKAALHATNSKLSLNFISFIKTWAKTGGNRQYIPLRPIRVEGKDTFILLVHSDVLYDLRTDSSFQQAMRDAQVRGDSNPLFADATAVWDNVIIYEHENCTIATDGGGSTVPWAKCVLLGAQALCWAWGRRPKLIKKTFDYENEKGIAWDVVCAAGKPQFNSIDYGSLGVYLSRTNVSGV